MVLISGARGVNEYKIQFAQRHGNKAVGVENDSRQYIVSRINVKTFPAVIGAVVCVFAIEKMRWFK